jgi:hypothetical protein
VHVYFNRGLPEVSCPSFVDNNVAFPPKDWEALPEKIAVSLTVGGEKMLHEIPEMPPSTPSRVMLRVRHILS